MEDNKQAMKIFSLQDVLGKQFAFLDHVLLA
jgi:hypothetical protein